MNTVALKNAAGITKMIVLADENGKALELSQSAAALLAAKTPFASVSRNNFSGSSARIVRGRKIPGVPFTYYVRVKG